MQRKYFDVVIVGGGIAGASAALASARLGVDTLLIEKETFPGGLATLSNVIVYLPLCDGLGNQVSAGIAEELLRLSVRDGFCRIPSCWEPGGDIEERKKTRFRVDFNPASFMLDLEELLLKEGVKILYDTRFCEIRKKGDRIDSLICFNKGGKVEINCKIVIDATGDADVCAEAGEETETLSTNVECAWFFHLEENLQSNNKIDEVKTNNEEQPSFKKRDFSLAINSLTRAFNANPNILPKGEKGYNGVDGDCVTEFTLAIHNMIRERIKTLRHNNPDKKIYPAILPLLPPFRSTRRLIGDYELKIEDEFKHFDDAVGIVSNWRKSGPIYQIPFRTIRASRNKNLLSAGRCISAVGEAWDVTRVIPACAVTGEAAGTAAAIACKNQLDDLKQININVLQKQLSTQGVILDFSL